MTSIIFNTEREIVGTDRVLKTLTGAFYEPKGKMTRKSVICSQVSSLSCASSCKSL